MLLGQLACDPWKAHKAVYEELLLEGKMGEAGKDLPALQVPGFKTY